MAKVYVSSTFEDLQECRKKARLVLQQLGHVDVAMETYVAETKRPLEKCLADVAASDLYVGIFAWRYGYVPRGREKSITELEYRTAVEHHKDCLIFLLNEDAPWPTKYVDDDKRRIRRLRSELMEDQVCSFFNTSDELAFIGKYSGCQLVCLPDSGAAEQPGAAAFGGSGVCAATAAAIRAAGPRCANASRTGRVSTNSAACGLCGAKCTRGSAASRAAQGTVGKARS